MIDPEKSKHRHHQVGPGDLWEKKRQFQISFLKRAGLQPQHFLLDFGCGTLRGGIPIIELLEPGHYYGIDTRAAVLSDAQQELQDYGLEDKLPTLLHSPDLSQLTIDRQFDYIWAFSVLIHLSDEILNDALGFIRRQLAPGGVFYANVNIGERNSGDGWLEFPLVRRSMDFYSQACAQSGLWLEDMGPLSDFGHGPDMNGPFEADRRMLKISSYNPANQS